MANRSTMDRLTELVEQLPEAVRVDVAEWGGHPTLRVRSKTFVFANDTATGMSVKLPKDEAAHLVAADEAIEPMGYGLGRHGWISFTAPDTVEDDRWEEIAEWVISSYCLVAPKALVAEAVSRGIAPEDP